MKRILAASIILVMSITGCSSLSQQESVSQEQQSFQYKYSSYNIDPINKENDYKSSLFVEFNDIQYRYPYTLKQLYYTVAILKNNNEVFTLYSDNKLTDELTQYEFLIEFKKAKNIIDSTKYMYSLLDKNTVIEIKNEDAKMAFSQNSYKTYTMRFIKQEMNKSMIVEMEPFLSGDLPEKLTF
jgi:hypothetical protein